MRGEVVATAVFAATAIATGLTLVLAFYLDFRRHNLIELGQLPASTPALFRGTWGTGTSVGLEVLQYVFSKEFAQSPDAATRFWVPYLRGGYILTTVMIVLAISLSWSGVIPTKS